MSDAARHPEPSASEERCAACGKQAKLRFTEISSGKRNSVYLCQNCAAAKGILEESEEGAVAELISEVSKRPPDEETLRCDTCGMTWGEFKTQSTLGCPDCYRAFRTPLGPLMQRLHRRTRHPGRRSRAAAATPPDLEALRGDLAQAVEAEDYELAAELRDRIRTLEEASPPDETGKSEPA